MSFTTLSAAGSGGKYPYIGHFITSTKYPDLIIVGGFDKASPPIQPYLAYSRDNGESWTDVSHLVEVEDGGIGFLTEDASGRVLVGISNQQTRTITVAEIKLKKVKQ